MICKSILAIVVLSIIFVSAGNTLQIFLKFRSFQFLSRITEADKIDRIFEKCNSLHENQGLSLAEVQHEDCQRILNRAGFQSDTLHETFKRFDSNADGFVTKEESRILMHSEL